MFVSGRVKDLAHTRGPIPILLEELWQGYRARALLPDVGCIVQNTRGFRVEATEKGGARGTANRILAEGARESHSFGSEPAESRCMNRVIPGRRDMRVQIVAHDEEDVFLLSGCWLVI